MRRKVIGHFKETLIAVCSTPSSPFNPGVPGMEPLLKFLFTERQSMKYQNQTVTQGPCLRQILGALTNQHVFKQNKNSISKCHITYQIFLASPQHKLSVFSFTLYQLATKSDFVVLRFGNFTFSDAASQVKKFTGEPLKFLL